MTRAETSQAASAAELDEPIRRGDTGVRILLTVLMAIIWSILRPVVGVAVFLSLLWTLITEQAPPYRVRELLNRLVTYRYRVGRYVTYNTAKVPFPFSDFPDAIEPPEDLGRDAAAEVRQHLGAEERRQRADPEEPE